MPFGPGFGTCPAGCSRPEADREAAQAALKTAFEDERLTQDEFESRVGRALAARTQSELAELTRDLPADPGKAAATRVRAVVRCRVRPLLPGCGAAARFLPSGRWLAGSAGSGCQVQAQLDEGTYPKGAKTPGRQMRELEKTRLTRDPWHGEWNYSLHPHTTPRRS